MMVETILESSQDYGMSNGGLPQWKRELLQRRAARSRPCGAPAPPPPPPPPLPAPSAEDEELSYGPGIVKRLKSRYLSLALRDAPRRRLSVLRRATSLEHLLDQRPPPAPRPAARAPRPASVAVPPASRNTPASRDFVKRARSVDALSRLDSREELAPPSPSPPPPPLAPRPPAPRAARPPRRPAPLLRDAERPPPDVVRSTLRKFESAPLRRAAPAARVSAVLRGLEGSRRSVTPDQEQEARSPSPTDAADAPPPPTTPPPPSTLAPPLPLEPPPPSFEPPPPFIPTPVPSSPTTAPITFPLSPTPLDPTILAPTTLPATEINAIPNSTAIAETAPPPLAPSPEPSVSPSRDEPEGCVQSSVTARVVSRAALESISRAGCTVRYSFEAPRIASHLPPLAATNTVLLARGARRVGVIRPMPASPRARPASPPAPEKPPPEETENTEPPKAAPRLSPPPLSVVTLVNGHSTPSPRAVSRIGAAGIERAWSGTHVQRTPAPSPVERATPTPAPAPWSRGLTGATRSRAPPAAATSVVFNFSDRKEVPDYVENDGLILRTSRRNRIKAGEPGVVVLRPEAVTRSGSDSEEDEGDSGPPSPCGVRFVNDNVLINGKSCMPPRPDRDHKRLAKLKLQFDDSLTRTFEYPSETSLCEESPTTPATTPAPAASPPPADAPATQLADNTHIASAALSRYTPHKTAPTSFQLGVTRRAPAPPAPHPAHPPHTTHPANGVESETELEAGAGVEESGGDARPCGADAARSWSEARTLATDLLF